MGSLCIMHVVVMWMIWGNLFELPYSEGIVLSHDPDNAYN